MIYNQASIKANPISASGYQIQLFVGYGETGLGDDAGSTNLGFQVDLEDFLCNLHNLQ